MLGWGDSSSQNRRCTASRWQQSSGNSRTPSINMNVASFTEEEFLARTQFWPDRMRTRGYRSYWDALRQTFAPSFRAEIDRIVAEVGG